MHTGVDSAFTISVSHIKMNCEMLAMYWRLFKLLVKTHSIGPLHSFDVIAYRLTVSSSGLEMNIVSYHASFSAQKLPIDCSWANVAAMLSDLISIF